MIDVIVPLFNKESKIVRCLESVINQTLLPNKLIIIDDGSTDNSKISAERVLNRYCGRYEIITTKNNGVSSARNFGLQSAESSYIAFLDADDFWDDSYLENALNLLMEHSDIGVLSFFHRVKKGAKVFMPNQGVGNNFSGFLKSYPSSARSGSPVHSSKVIIKKSLLEGIGGFPEGNGLTEDLYVWLRLSKVSRFYISNKCLVTVDKGIDPSRPSRLGMQPYILEFFLSTSTFSSLNKDEVKYLRYIYVYQSLYAIRYGNRVESMSRIRLGIRYFPLFSVFLKILVVIFTRRK